MSSVAFNKNSCSVFSKPLKPSGRASLSQHKQALTTMQTLRLPERMLALRVGPNSVLGLTERHHQQDSVHDSLKKDASNRRPVEARFLANATVISSPHFGGFHHRYCWA
jgi:hypothetical protein